MLVKIVNITIKWYSEKIALKKRDDEEGIDISYPARKVYIKSGEI